MRIKVNKAGSRKDIRRIFLCMIIAIISTHTLLLILVLTKSVNVSQTRNYAYVAEKSSKRDTDTDILPHSSSSPQIATKSDESDPLKDLIRLKGSASLLLSTGGPGLLSAISGLSAITPNRVNLFWCTKSEYRPEVGPLIALASFPGSGNTWIRYLLQQASGSVYKDYSLLRNGFPAESVANGSVIIVKTHEWGLYARRQFDKAVLLIRNPFKTLLAEFNRRSAGHLGHASPDRYLKGKGTKTYLTHFHLRNVRFYTRKAMKK
ncbi:WSCD family member-like protein [Leptotrombidium deliense]|uniref:WSCD family member-like protein n=1 Tax=Leptotrombidium deliense TaxID=299467 RepID=A0A443SSE1_9ACAR|nr:WSCD family member-like protein [Leptotrombidium deliense]